MLTDMLFLAEGDDFTVVEPTAVDGESHECPLFVPPLHSGCSWIDVQQLELLVELHFQNVRMSTDEELRWVGVDLAPYAGVIMAGIASNVFHKYGNALALPSEFLGEHLAQVASVAIAIDSTEWTELIQPHGNLK